MSFESFTSVYPLYARIITFLKGVRTVTTLCDRKVPSLLSWPKQLDTYTSIFLPRRFSLIISKDQGILFQEPVIPGLLSVIIYITRYNDKSSRHLFWNWIRSSHVILHYIVYLIFLLYSLCVAWWRFFGLSRRSVPPSLFTAAWAFV